VLCRTGPKLSFAVSSRGLLRVSGKTKKARIYETVVKPEQMQIGTRTTSFSKSVEETGTKKVRNKGMKFPEQKLASWIEKEKTGGRD
jgi:hypothetical protein